MLLRHVESMLQTVLGELDRVRVGSSQFRQLFIVQQVGPELVNERVEGQAVLPAVGEVFDVHASVSSNRG